MADQDERDRDESAPGDMLGGIARGPIVQSDTDRDLVRDRADEARRSDEREGEESTRAEDRDRYGIPDPNRGLNVRD